MTDKELFGNSEQLDATEQQKSTEQPSATDTNVATTDSISRAAVVDAIEGVDWYHQNQHGEMVHGANPDDHQAWYKAEDIYKAVESVPSAQQWIPCSERLPEVGRSVLLSVGSMYTAEGCLRDDGDWAQFRWTATLRKDRVDAWCPLPEPWKGERDG